MAYTTIDDPSAHFQTTLYSGTGSSQAITNGGNSDLQPDLIWIKNRANTHDHVLMDSTRGVTKRLAPNTTDAEETSSNYVSAFSSDGFTVVSEGAANASSSGSYAAWQWKANGGTTSSNTNGTITTTVQANATAGFSIATYTGVGAARTIGHGLAAAPQFCLIKNRTAAANWNTSCWFLTGDNDKKLKLNLNEGESSTSNFQDTDPSSTVVSIGGGNEVGGEWENVGNYNYVAYFWIPIQGYSKFGSYTGNGNVDGPFVYTGFKPAFVIIKRAVDGGSSQWHTFDSTRNESNVVNKVLFPSTTDVESTYSGSDPQIDILSNGFKLRSSYNQVNASSGNYIHICFAEQPFVTSGGVPCTAR